MSELRQQIVDALANRDYVTVSGLARGLDASRAAVHKYLNALVEIRFIRKDKSREVL